MFLGLLAAALGALVAAETGGAGGGVGITPAPIPAPPAPWAVPARWSEQRVPAPGPPQSIGAYAGGCLQGASSLSPSGPGYALLHPRRNRFYGHPDLIAFIRRLAATARARRLGPVAVGDLSQARGGPTPTGHRSHQSGLDVDVSYSGGAVVDLGTHAMTARWGRGPAALLAAAASDPSVDRVFVNPSIKRALCQGPARGEPWFARLRPWWGHHDHFHVRLKCPADSPLCQAQEAPVVAADGSAEQDDGCGASLAWWFTPDALATQARRKQADQASGPVLPEACAALVGAR